MVARKRGRASSQGGLCDFFAGQSLKQTAHDKPGLSNTDIHNVVVCLSDSGGEEDTADAKPEPDASAQQQEILADCELDPYSPDRAAGSANENASASTCNCASAMVEGDFFEQFAFGVASALDATAQEDCSAPATAARRMEDALHNPGAIIGRQADGASGSDAGRSAPSSKPIAKRPRKQPLASNVGTSSGSYEKGLVEGSEAWWDASGPEGERAVRKWQGLASHGTTVQERRFQMLVAAILHPKTSERVVREHMDSLRSWARREERGTLRAATLVGVTVDVLKAQLEGVHWHKVKAQRIISAAEALRERWNGEVPYREKDLLTLPGIGPQSAGLLAFVFQAVAPPECEVVEVA